jgi:hypothetical protein
VLPNGAGDFAALEKLLHKKPPAAPGERCDFCAAPIAAEHGHLIDLKARRILCGCRPCWLVFEPQGAAQGRYRPIPRRYVAIDDLALDGAAWDALQIPIGLAFFFFNSLEAKLCAFYPGPAGATESELPLGEWNATIATHPVLATLAPDVEAILIRRSAGTSRLFLVPIDAAYELVGIIRTVWKGFDGGEEARLRIDAFFATIDERARGVALEMRP